MEDEEFLDAILEDAGDEGRRLAYADWLEERGDPRAEFLRLEHQYLETAPDDARGAEMLERLGELSRTLDSEWVRLIRSVELDPLDALREIVAPPKRPHYPRGDWEALELALGLRFPTDYKRYIEVYGGGGIGPIAIDSPFVPSRHDPKARWRGWAAYFQDLAQYETVPYPSYPEPGGLLPFGSLGDVHTLAWLTVGESDRWPMVYHSREEGFFELPGVTAVEFVLQAVTRRLPLFARLRVDKNFNGPLEFRADPMNLQFHRFITDGAVDYRGLVAQLESRWPADQARLVYDENARATLTIEPLAGCVWFNPDTGDERVLAGIHYDEHYATISPQEIIVTLLAAGFRDVSR